MKKNTFFYITTTFFAILTSFSFAQNSSSLLNSLSSSSLAAESSSSYNCSCHTSKEEAEQSFLALTTECDERGGENKFVFNKVDDYCYCIDGSCNYYFSSSSGNPVESSSSFSKPTSSSSSSEYVYNGTMCSIPDNLYAPLSTLPTVHQHLYSSLPHMTNTDKISVSACSCNKDGSFKCTYKNFGLGQGYTPSYVSLCGFKEAYWCSGISKGVCDYTGSSKEIYYSDRYNATDYTWGAMSFSGTEVMDMENGYQPVYVKSNIGTLRFFNMRHVLPANVTTYDLENAFLKANPRFPSLDRMNDYCRGEWVPHDEDCFGTEQESVEAAEDSSSDCALAAGRAHYSHEFTTERGWCVAGKCEGGDFYSSAAESSSSGEFSSSSGGVLCEAHPFTSVPENPRLACFEVSGKCYKCNDDRGSECANDWLWIYGFNASNVGWWYTEVDCETGSEKTTEEGIGVCPSHPLNKVPSDPQNACFASNGKCYQCNGDRGSECANDWLWIYDFNASNVGWWYEEVDCYNPNGDDGQCPDGSILQKSVAKANGNSQIESVDYSIDFLPSQKYFDVLGRKTNHSSKQKRALYTKTPNLKNEQFGIDEIEGGSISGKIKGNSRDFCYKNSSGKWVCSESHSLLKTNGETSNANKCNEILGIDYGYMKKDIMVGGITCAWPDVYLDSLISGYTTPKDEKISCCSNGLIKNLITYRFITISTLGENKMFVVSVGYKFSEDHVATEELVEAFQKHENGHYKYNQCVEFDDSEVVTEIEFCGELSEAIADSIGLVLRDSLVEKRLNEGQHKLDSIADLFHENFGLGGYSESYTCPVQ